MRNYWYRELQYYLINKHISFLYEESSLTKVKLSPPFPGTGSTKEYWRYFLLIIDNGYNNKTVMYEKLEK